MSYQIYHFQFDINSMFPGNMQVQNLVFSMSYTQMKQYTSVSRIYSLICGHKVLKMNYDKATS